MIRLFKFGHCFLTDEVLICRIEELTQKMYKENEVPQVHTLPNANYDYDVLIAELIHRYETLKGKYIE